MESHVRRARVQLNSSKRTEPQRFTVSSAKESVGPKAVPVALSAPATSSVRPLKDASPTTQYWVPTCEASTVRLVAIGITAAKTPPWMRVVSMTCTRRTGLRIHLR